jgi:hypothetical protein
MFLIISIATLLYFFAPTLYLKNFFKIFFPPFSYKNKNENATNYFDCFELSDFNVDHVIFWLYDYRK